eukprot:7557725-Pyramimonas_sp.AAC.1
MGVRYSLSGLLLVLLLVSRPLTVSSAWFSMGLGWHEGDEAPSPPSPPSESISPESEPAAPESAPAAPESAPSESATERQEGGGQETVQLKELQSGPVSSVDAIRLTPPGVYSDITARKADEPFEDAPFRDTVRDMDALCIPEGQEDKYAL